jgi:protoporphyrinogen oxidase
MFPSFSESWVLEYRVWKEPYSQPVVGKRYSEKVPTFDTPVRNLHLATMAQIYPEDRGTNYAIREGAKAAERILSKL